MAGGRAPRRSNPVVLPPNVGPIRLLYPSVSRAGSARSRERRLRRRHRSAETEGRRTEPTRKGGTRDEAP